MCLKTHYHLAHPYLESVIALSDTHTVMEIMVFLTNKTSQGIIIITLSRSNRFSEKKCKFKYQFLVV